MCPSCFSRFLNPGAISGSQYLDVHSLAFLFEVKRNTKKINKWGGGGGVERYAIGEASETERLRALRDAANSSSGPSRLRSSHGKLSLF